VTRPRRRSASPVRPALRSSIDTHPPRRALLFCPATERHKLEKAAGLGADAVIIDLEDSVAPSRKADARAGAARALAELDFGRSERLVRVNPRGSGLEEDVRATGSIRTPPHGYVLPKVGSAAEVKAFASLLAGLERKGRLRPGTIRILAIIETAIGIVRLDAIATSDPRLEALMFGAEDLCGDMGAVRTREGREIAYPRSAVAIHAAARGLQAIDTPFIDIKDTEGLVAETREALALGYSGKLAIHPGQVGPIQETFTPRPEELEEARLLIEEHERQQARGAGVFVLGGRMIDMPMVRAARAVLARGRAAATRGGGR
jgi:citrate lyase subunit beta-like protein